jgi:hypothetical protein
LIVPEVASVAATSVAESLHSAQSALCAHEKRPHLHHVCHGVVPASPGILAVPLVWSVVLRTAVLLRLVVLVSTPGREVLLVWLVLQLVLTWLVGVVRLAGVDPSVLCFF